MRVNMTPGFHDLIMQLVSFLLDLLEEIHKESVMASVCPCNNAANFLLLTKEFSDEAFLSLPSECGFPHGEPFSRQLYWIS